jgi:PAS domain S-box-containing protein
MMIAQAAIHRQQYHSRLNQFHATASQANRRSHATLIVNGLGSICGCGAAVEDILGASRSRLIGKRVSGFIAGLFREGSSPSYNARYLAHLDTNSEWRQFEATDARGSRFVVEINVLRRMADGGEVFVLDLRRPGNAT